MAIIKKFRIKSFKENKPLIRLEKISFSFGKRQLLENITFNINNPDIILMKNVFAKVEIFKKDTIYIKSFSAKYNLSNYETNFNKDVELTYLNHVIFTENMDLSFQKNFAWLYTDVVYKSSDYELFADKIEIDLITKNSKIYTNNSKKVKIIKK